MLVRELPTQVLQLMRFTEIGYHPALDVEAVRMRRIGSGRVIALRTAAGAPAPAEGATGPSLGCSASRRFPGVLCRHLTGEQVPAAPRRFRKYRMYLSARQMLWGSAGIDNYVIVFLE